MMTWPAARQCIMTRDGGKIEHGGAMAKGLGHYDAEKPYKLAGRLHVRDYIIT